MKIPFSRERIFEAFKILSFFLFLPVFLLGTIAPVLNADVVIYVSGKTDKNVKTKLQRKTLFIRYENGSSKEVSKKLVKTVKFLPAIWSVQVPENLSEKKRQEYLQKLEAEEEKRLEEETGDGNEWIPRPETDFVSPTLIAGKSIFPFYS
ncbi:MAG: hypothetical protein KDK54_22055, partial [Leptospiraceae bacterium]|nr:hypothetical protein [Leptospiraceae bacterium]